jgi:DNA-binding transcriptional LysR family regulator
VLNPWRLRLLSQLDALGTVRAVAEAVNQSASSVSQQLSVLEAEAGTPLLERTGRRVRLTPAGQVLARRARAILDHMASVEAELRGLGEEPAGLVRLGAFQSAIHTFAAPAAARLARSHPNLHIELLELEPHDGIPALRLGDADIVITMPDHVGVALGQDVDVVPLAVDQVVLVVPPERAGAGPADLADHAGEPWAFDVPGSYMATLAMRLCRQAGFEPRVASRFGNHLLTLQHVEAGRAVALLPALAVDGRFRVATRELTPAVTRTIAAVLRRGTRPRPAVDLVLEAVRRLPAPLGVRSQVGEP